MKPTIDGQQTDTKKSQPSSNANPFPVLPAEFGRYRVLRLLGRGGMGAVYLAEDSQLGRQVALKMPFFDPSESSKRVERFVREARSAAALHHPNICTVFDAGQIDDRPFITMAYIPGKPLEDEIDPDVPMPQLRAAEIVRKVALALEHAHAKGTVHRDLKPANVMMSSDGEPVVMDFGLAKRIADVDPSEAKLTRPGGILGTPSYMSPEQVKGDGSAIGPASDVYSLGVMLFEMLTGKTPYSGSLGVVMGQILAAPVPPVREFRAEVDSRLDAICQMAMAKEPAERFASMAEFADTLGKIAKAPVSPPPPLPAPAGRPKSRTSTVVIEDSPPDALDERPPPTSALGRAKRSRAGIGMIALTLILAIPLGWWLLTTLLRPASPTGTLLVEMGDDVKIRFEGGKLVLYGPDGKVRDTLAASERNKKVDAGTYTIRVEGADGLAVDKPEFVLEEGGQVTVRVTVVASVLGPENSEWAGTGETTSQKGLNTVGGTWTFTERRGQGFKALWRSGSGAKTIFEGVIDANGRITFHSQEQVEPTAMEREPVTATGQIVGKRMSTVVEYLSGNKVRIAFKLLPDGGKSFAFQGRWKCEHLPKKWTGDRTVVDETNFIDFNGDRGTWERDGGLIVVHWIVGREWLVIDPDNPNVLKGRGGDKSVTWTRQ